MLINIKLKGNLGCLISSEKKIFKIEIQMLVFTCSGQI